MLGSSTVAAALPLTQPKPPTQPKPRRRRRGGAGTNGDTLESPLESPLGSNAMRHATLRRAAAGAAPASDAKPAAGGLEAASPVVPQPPPPGGAASTSAMSSHAVLANPAGGATQTARNSTKALPSESRGGVSLLAQMAAKRQAKVAQDRAEQMARNKLKLAEKERKRAEKAAQQAERKAEKAAGKAAAKANTAAEKPQQRQRDWTSKTNKVLSALATSGKLRLEDEMPIPVSNSTVYRLKDKVLGDFLHVMYEAAGNSTKLGNAILTTVLAHPRIAAFGPITNAKLETTEAALLTAIRTGLEMLTPEIRMTNDGRATLTTLLEFFVKNDASRADLLALSKLLLVAGEEASQRRRGWDRKVSHFADKLEEAASRRKQPDWPSGKCGIQSRRSRSDRLQMWTVQLIRDTIDDNIQPSPCQRDGQCHGPPGGAVECAAGAGGGRAGGGALFGYRSACIARDPCSYRLAVSCVQLGGRSSAGPTDTHTHTHTRARLWLQTLPQSCG